MLGVQRGCNAAGALHGCCRHRPDHELPGAHHSCCIHPAAAIPGACSAGAQLFGRHKLADVGPGPVQCTAVAACDEQGLEQQIRAQGSGLVAAAAADVEIATAAAAADAETAATADAETAASSAGNSRAWAGCLCGESWAASVCHAWVAYRGQDVVRFHAPQGQCAAMHHMPHVATWLYHTFRVVP